MWTRMIATPALISMAGRDISLSSFFSSCLVGYPLDSPNVMGLFYLTIINADHNPIHAFFKASKGSSTHFNREGEGICP